MSMTIRIGLVAAIRRLIIATVVLTLCLVMVGVPTSANGIVDPQHRYTPLELADMSRAQLAELVLTLQKQPAAVVAEQTTPAVPSSPLPQHRTSRTLLIAGAALGSVLLLSSMHSHPSFGSSSPSMSLASARRAPLAATTTCNPATTLGCGVNITSATCSTVQGLGGLISAGLTTYAAQNASGHTQPVGQVAAAPSGTVAGPGGTTLTTSGTVTYLAATPASATQAPTVATAQGGAGTTGTIWTSVANFAVSTSSLWIGCNNQVNNNGTSTVSTSTSSIRR